MSSYQIFGEESHFDFGFFEKILTLLWEALPQKVRHLNIEA